MIDDMTINWYKSIAENKLAELMKEGFAFQGNKFPADLQAQTASIHAWDHFQQTGDDSILGFDSKANIWIAMDEATFKAFKLAGQNFVMQMFQKVWKFKRVDLVNAQDANAAETAFQAWLVEASNLGK